MVGTRRTNSCSTCRKRRVKCDEVRPVCGQCAKRGRECKESPPAGVIWANNGQLCAPPPTHGQTALESEAASLGSDFVPKELALISTTTASNGAIMHTYRARPLSQSRSASSSPVKHVPRSPSLDSIDKLRSSFMVAFQECPIGYRISHFNHRFGDMPRYMGHSQALDNAIRCALNAHSVLVATKGRHDIDPTAYLKALTSMQRSLQDPEQAFQSTTLSAVAVLSFAEVLGSRFASMNYVNHAGGLVTLLKEHGQKFARDPLGCAVLYGSTGTIIVDAMMKGIPCFLNEPEWKWLYTAKDSHTQSQAAFRILTPQFSYLADLVTEVRSVCSPHSSATDVQVLVSRALALRSRISQTLKDLKSTVNWEPTSRCSIESDISMTNVTYWFKDLISARIAVQGWAMVIQVSGILARLYPLLSESTNQILTESTMKKMHLQSMEHAEDICRCLEYAKQFLPLGSLWLSYPIFCAWEYLPSIEQDQMTAQLNILHGNPTPPYNRASMQYLSDILLGHVAITGQDVWGELFTDEGGKENHISETNTGGGAICKERL